MFQTHEQNLASIESARRKLEIPRAVFEGSIGDLTKRIKRHEAYIRSIYRNRATLQKHREDGFTVPQCIFDGFDGAVEYNQACITFIRFLKEC